MERTARAAIARPLAFATMALCVMTLLACGGRWLWIGDLLCNFRTHFALLAGVALVLAIAFRRWRMAGIAALALVLNVWPMFDAFFGTGAPPVADARAVRIAAFNVNIANDDMPAIAAYLRSQEVDVAVLEELSPANATRLAELLPEFAHRLLAENEGIWGVVILSRWPMIAPGRAENDGQPIGVRAEIDLGDRTFVLYGAHLNWPVIPASARTRDAQLAAIGRELTHCARACVIVGDFNVTPWSSHFRDVVNLPGVHDCAAGRGLLMSWSAGIPAPVRIRIDQCITAGAVSVTGVRIGQSVGSDHFATFNDLQIGRPAGR